MPCSRAPAPDASRSIPRSPVFFFLRFSRPDCFISDRNVVLIHTMLEPPISSMVSSRSPDTCAPPAESQYTYSGPFPLFMLLRRDHYKRLRLCDRPVTVLRKDRISAFCTVSERDHRITGIQFHSHSSSPPPEQFLCSFVLLYVLHKLYQSDPKKSLFCTTKRQPSDCYT